MNLFEKILSGKEEVLKNISYSLDHNLPFLLTYFNQHCFNIYFRNKIYRKMLEQNFDVYPDGIGIHLFQKYKLKMSAKRMDATSVNYAIMNFIADRKEKIFIVGGNFDEDLIRNNLEEKKIELAGYHSGFFKEEERNDLIKKIVFNECRIILVGMGVPEQEIFAQVVSDYSYNKIIICVGNFFEFYFGRIKRAPVFIQKIGLEWMFRIITEPKRLWQRYLLGIPEFIYRGMKIKL